jgi:hypothetical protein
MKKIAPDKWKHFYVGIIVGLVIEAFAFWLLRDHLILATILTLIVVIAVCYGFELLSLITGKGHYDFFDAVAGTIGGSIGIVIAWSFRAIV